MSATATAPPPAPVPAAEAPQQPVAANGAATTGGGGGGGGGASANGAAKQRQRAPLPLPDPLPETPVKKYPEPSRSEHQAAVEKVDAQLQQCFDRLKATKDFYDSRAKIREAGRPAFEEVKGRLQEMQSELRALFDKKKDITARIKAIRDADYEGARGGASGGDFGGGKIENEAMKGLRSVEDVDEKIRELEHHQSSASMSLQDEKKLVAKIGFLASKGRELIAEKEAAFKSERAAKTQRIEDRKALEEERKAMDGEIDKLKARLDEKHAAMDKLRKEQDVQIKAIQDLAQDIDRDAEKAKITELKAKIKAMRDEFQEERDKWFLNERIIREQAKIAKRKRWEAAQAEREEKRKAWEAEQAQYPVADPYQPEKDMCAALIYHLETLMGVAEKDRRIKADSTTSTLLPTVNGGAPTLGSKKESREVNTGGKAIGKSTTEIGSFGSDGFNQFAALRSGSSKKNRRGRKSSGGDVSSPASGKAPTAEAAEDSKLTLSIEHHQFFQHLEITAPIRRSDMKEALEAVQKKKEYFDNDPPAKETLPKKSNSENSTGEGSGAASGKKSTKTPAAAPPAPGESPSAFPELGDSSTAPVSAVEGDSKKPSFLSVVDGTAAPPPAPEATPAEAAASETVADTAAAVEGDADAGEVEGATTNGVVAAETDAPAMNGSVAPAISETVPQKSAAAVVKGSVPTATSAPVSASP